MPTTRFFTFTRNARLACLVTLLTLTCQPGLPARVLAQAATVVQVLPAQSQVNVDTTTTVSLNVIGGVDVNAFDLTILYNPSVVTLESWSTGPYLSNLFEVKKEVQAGRIRLVYTQLATPGANGDGVLLNLVFRGLAESQSDIILDEVIFAAHAGGMSYPTRENGVISVLPPQPATATPSPTLTATLPPTNTATPLPSQTSQPSSTPMPSLPPLPSATIIPSPTVTGTLALSATSALPSPAPSTATAQAATSLVDATLNQPIPTMTRSAVQPTASSTPLVAPSAAAVLTPTAQPTPPPTGALETLLWVFLVVGLLAIAVLVLLFALRSKKSHVSKDA